MTGLIPSPFNMAVEAPVELYNMLDDFFTNTPRGASSSVFKVDIQEDDNGYVVEADLPGVSKDDIDVEMEDEHLVISVNHDESSDTSDESKNYIHRERRQVSMKRGAILRDADADAITAKLENGVLTVNVPKKAPVSNSRKISVD